MKLTHSMSDLNQQTQIVSCCTEGMIYIPSETTATGTRGWRVRGVEVKTVTSSDKTARHVPTKQPQRTETAQDRSVNKRLGAVTRILNPHNQNAQLHDP